MNKKKNKILYLMHVDWNWIKQRPHFIAEGLVEKYSVFVLYRLNPNRKSMVKNKSKIKRMPFIPIPRRTKLITILDNIIQRALIHLLCFFYRPDYIWITFPNQYNYIPDSLKGKAKLIYDCMDDAPGFYTDSNKKNELIKTESNIIKDSFLVLCSSRNLIKVLTRRYGENRYLLLRNALSENYLNRVLSLSGDSNNESSLIKKCEEYIDIVYIGTVASWIDYDSILYCLNEIKNIRFHFIGPIEKKISNGSNRVIYYGPINHDDLIKNKDQYDILIMPFIRNDLIESVDPVKLYEYLSFNKEVISIYYPEIKRFKDYIHFYNNKEELKGIIYDLVKTDANHKNKIASTNRFLIDNTWKKRVESVIKYLGEENK
ncbi:Uncharacterised protein [Mycobacteroides abscessus subsp. abscessus]|nr:Uncharacterised protein [Mycobacteroides abscessus subsp. abscessus]